MNSCEYLFSVKIIFFSFSGMENRFSSPSIWPLVFTTFIFGFVIFNFLPLKVLYLLLSGIGIVWGFLGWIFIKQLNMVFRELVVSDLLRAAYSAGNRSIREDSVPYCLPIWLPFLRPPSSDLPPKWILYLTAVTLGPLRALGIFLILCCSALACSCRASWGQPVYSFLGNCLNFLILWKFEVVGDIDEKCRGIVANHSSVIDEHVLWMLGRRIVWVAKEEVKKIPLMGMICKSIGSIFVDRRSEAGRLKAVEEIKAFLLSSKTGFPLLVVFPEGTCSNSLFLLPFKPTAFSTGVYMQPAAISISNPHAAFALNDSSLIHAALLFSLPTLSIRIDLLPAVITAEEARASISKAAEIPLAPEGEGAVRGWPELSKYVKKLMRDSGLKL